MNWSGRLEVVKSQCAHGGSFSLMQSTGRHVFQTVRLHGGGEPPGQCQGTVRVTHKLCSVTEVSRLIYYHSAGSLCKEDVRLDC